MNHGYLASIVREADVNKILAYKDHYNSFNMHERERPMLHDSNAFKNRPLSASKSSNFNNKRTSDVNLNNNFDQKNNSKKVDLKILLKTTVTKPFHHKNFSEIPD